MYIMEALNPSGMEVCIGRHGEDRRIPLIILPILALCFSCFFISCSGGYSFTGASIPPNAKTLSLRAFPNYASSVNPTLSQQLYERLRSMYESQTSLSVISSDGDLQVSGEITGYVTQASALSANDNVATNRLTVTIKVKFVNLLDSDVDFEQSFSRYKEYDASRDFSAVENSLVDELVEELADDIFNKTVVNW